MPRGGARAGAGRKAGGSNAKTRAIAMQAAAEGITPLEVMVNTMRHLWGEGKILAASAVAKDAAPYMHPRLQSTEFKGHAEVTVTDSGADRPPRESRDEWIARRGREMAANLSAMAPAGSAD